MLPETSTIEALEVTTAPAETWHYWIAFASATGPGSVAVTLPRALTTVEQVQRIQRKLATNGAPGAIVLSWTLLRVDGQAHACLACGRGGAR